MNRPGLSRAVMTVSVIDTVRVAISGGVRRVTLDLGRLCMMARLRGLR